jgi:putative superfamily III holin-X
MQARIEERPLGELFGELANKTGVLFRQELELAKVELSENASVVGSDAATLVAGGFVAYAGFLAVLAAIVVGLATFMPLWLAALATGLVVIIVGYALIRRSLDSLKRHDLAPRQTLATIHEDAEWVKEQMR